ncbi:MAG: class I SAM-dependent methyltransferase [Xanthobacteraceae bacterium]|nr:class I SAM-dependent methyltransferase [Xanthobacteraceae bacterium]
MLRPFRPAERVGTAGEVVGIDLAEEMARATNEEAVRRGFAARVRVMDAEHLDFPDAAFDRVLCGFGRDVLSGSGSRVRRIRPRPEAAWAARGVNLACDAGPRAGHGDGRIAIQSAAAAGLNALDAAQAERLRAALLERMRPHQRPDGTHVPAAALLAVATR